MSSVHTVVSLPDTAGERKCFYQSQQYCWILMVEMEWYFSLIQHDEDDLYIRPVRNIF